jgi:hypothetical protein
MQAYCQLKFETSIFAPYLKTFTMYSTDFHFFLQEQIGVSTTNGGRQVHFFSRLEKRSFKTIICVAPLSDSQINQHCLIIFNDLVRVRKPEDFDVRRIYNEHTDRLRAIIFKQGDGELTIEIQLSRYGASSLYSIRKYVDVDPVHDETIWAHNWSQAYLYAKALLSFPVQTES